jgi:hypothetical protein
VIWEFLGAVLACIYLLVLVPVALFVLTFRALIWGLALFVRPATRIRRRDAEPEAINHDYSQRR